MPRTILKSGLLRCKVTLRSGKLTFTKKPGVIIQACLPGLLNTERFYIWRLSGSARQSQIGILCFDWLIHPGVSYSREIRTK